MPVRKLTKKEVKEIFGNGVVMPAPKPSGRVVRTATAEDYRIRNYSTIGTFFRAKDMKPKP